MAAPAHEDSVYSNLPPSITTLPRRTPERRGPRRLIAWTFGLGALALAGMAALQGVGETAGVLLPTPVATIFDSSSKAPALPVRQPSMARQLVEGMNIVRSSAGLSPLVADPRLTDVAVERAADMATRGYFAHVDPEGDRAYVELLDAAGSPFTAAGENLARNNYAVRMAASRALASLMASELHHENIVDPEFERVGVGAYTTTTGEHYFAAVFTD